MPALQAGIGVKAPARGETVRVHDAQRVVRQRILELLDLAHLMTQNPVMRDHAAGSAAGVNAGGNIANAAERAYAAVGLHHRYAGRRTSGRAKPCIHRGDDVGCRATIVPRDNRNRRPRSDCCIGTVPQPIDDENQPACGVFENGPAVTARVFSVLWQTNSTDAAIRRTMTALPYFEA